MTRHVQHAHHLKGLLHCGTCGARMLLDFATNPRGTTYAYFVCSGRASKRTSCTRRAVPVAVAERLVADSYASITISDQTYRHLAAEVDAAFDSRMAGRDQEIADLMANRAKLEAESDKLLVARARKIQRFLSQPFFVAEVFTGSPGKYVSLKDTIAGFKGILNGDYDHLPEQAFYMVGGIEEAIEKAKKL